MNRDDHTPPACPDPTPLPNGKGNSGEGSETALKALIKKRQLQADDGDTTAPAPTTPQP